MDRESDLIGADKVEMEDRKTTHKPNGNEAVKDEDH